MASVKKKALIFKLFKDLVAQERFQDMSEELRKERYNFLKKDIESMEVYNLPKKIICSHADVYYYLDSDENSICSIFFHRQGDYTKITQAVPKQFIFT